MVEAKDPVSEKTIRVKSITEDVMRCSHLKDAQFPREGFTVRMATPNSMSTFYTNFFQIES
jgi:hypothetical protein